MCIIQIEVFFLLTNLLRFIKLRKPNQIKFILDLSKYSRLLNGETGLRVDSSRKLSPK